MVSFLSAFSQVAAFVMTGKTAIANADLASDISDDEDVEVKHGLQRMWRRPRGGAY
jgi:hypothetical protein